MHGGERRKSLAIKNSEYRRLVSLKKKDYITCTILHKIFFIIQTSVEQNYCIKKTIFAVPVRGIAKVLYMCPL